MGGRRRASTHSVPEPAQVRIERVGAEGDGIARLADGSTVYVPFALPDEVVRVVPERRRGKGWATSHDALIEASTDRVGASCAFFGTCGGCALQHWSSEPYLRWKEGLLRSALERAGFVGVGISPIRAITPLSRRRIDLGLRRTAGSMAVGFHCRRGGVVDLRGDTCAVMVPRLAALIEPLRDVLGRLSGLRREGEAEITWLETGADVVLRTDGELVLSDRTRLARFSYEAGLVRLCWARGDAMPELVCGLGDAVVRFAGVAVPVPPGGFLQASAEGEEAIIETVLAGLPEGVRANTIIGELFAGCGTLTFPLAQHARVRAWEGDGEAVSAMLSGARRAGLASRVQVVQRDLARRPVEAAILRGFPVVVLDPPFAGALAQIGAIAEARVQRVIYVSCNPAVLSRDAAVLQRAGYRVVAATPIDQFVWSARLESVVVFDHAGRATRGCERADCS